jgi:hypothetical protein
MEHSTFFGKRGGGCQVAQLLEYISTSDRLWFNNTLWGTTSQARREKTSRDCEQNRSSWEAAHVVHLRISHLFAYHSHETAEKYCAEGQVNKLALNCLICCVYVTFAISEWWLIVLSALCRPRSTMKIKVIPWAHQKSIYKMNCVAGEKETCGVASTLHV